MGASKKLKKAMIDKDIKQTDLSAVTGRAVQTLRNIMSRDNMNYATVEELADALGCDIVLRDRETGRIYD